MKPQGNKVRGVIQYVWFENKGGYLERKSLIEDDIRVMAERKTSRETQLKLRMYQNAIGKPDILWANFKNIN